MRKATLEEFEEIKSRGGGSKWSKVFLEMEVKNVIYIESKEWDLRSTPICYLGNYKRRTGLVWSTRSVTKDGKVEGWYVIRLK